MIFGGENGSGMFNRYGCRVHRMGSSLREYIWHRRTVGRNQAVTGGKLLPVLICRFRTGKRVGFTTSVDAVPPDWTRTRIEAVTGTVVGCRSQMGIWVDCESANVHTQRATPREGIKGWLYSVERVIIRGRAGDDGK